MLPGSTQRTRAWPTSRLQPSKRATSRRLLSDLSDPNLAQPRQLRHDLQTLTLSRSLESPARFPGKFFFWREIRRSEKIFHESSWRKKRKKLFRDLCHICLIRCYIYVWIEIGVFRPKGGQAWWSITEPCKTVYDCHGIKFKLYHNHQNSSAYLTITVSLGMLTADCSADWSMLGQCCSRSVLNLLFNILPGEVGS